MTENIAGACACSMRKEFNLSFGRKGNKNVQPFFSTLLEQKLKSDIARFTTHVQTC